MAGRPRIPTAIHVAQGKMQPGTPHYARFQEQGRANEPLPPAPIVAEAPDYMDDFEKPLWTLALSLIPPGVVGSSDQVAFEMLIILWAKMRQRTIASVEYSQLRGLCVQFGMNPSARSKVTGTSAKREDDEGSDSENEF